MIQDQHAPREAGDYPAERSEGDHPIHLPREVLQEDDPIAAALLTFLDGVTFFKPRTVYVSTPITTGSWFYQELARRGGKGYIEHLPSRLVDEVRAAAIEVNRKATDDALRWVRSQLTEYNFVNPVNLQVSAWSQPQYISFWVDVIERSVGRVVLTPGWSFSTGCTHECAQAISHGIATFDHRLVALTARDAADRVHESISHVRDLGLEPTKLIAAAEELKPLAEGPA